MLLDQRNSLHFLFDYWLGQASVSETFIVSLSFGQHPFQKAFDRIAFRGIRNLRRDQEPGETRDGIHGRPGLVRDRHAEIIWHVLRRRSRCRGDARQIRLYEFPGSVLNLSKSDGVLNGVDEFHVSDRIGRLLYETSHTLVSLAAQPNWPLYGRAFTDFVLPIIACL